MRDLSHGFRSKSCSSQYVKSHRNGRKILLLSLRNFFVIQNFCSLAFRVKLQDQRYFMNNLSLVPTEFRLRRCGQLWRHCPQPRSHSCSDGWTQGGGREGKRNTVPLGGMLVSPHFLPLTLSHRLKRRSIRPTDLQTPTATVGPTDGRRL